MTQQQSKRQARRGRIFPELTISPEEQARQESERKVFHQKGRVIFERLQPELIENHLIENHYNWFIVIEPNTEDYFVAQDSMTALNKALEKHPQARFATFRLNETGVCGRI
ncbi:hypothetical protein NDI37_03475 [Funiculus sociatus GB2-A5]|uniref:Uncharacterized protein n=1 Tax=Funiculus sociatus GB2-A5 TaxID=2933946 RepID=A0ABV0JJB7_9CYAN|nr:MULTISPECIES: hypothetical protein [unclassified Trichocoleus]MBD1908693.1 hypothetical protein [Trichocoleus sp. FACHB-832]MBD2063315.1 hypothetical protein [Trichocoleus sp. FACHB-6]